MTTTDDSLAEKIQKKLKLDVNNGIIVGEKLPSDFNGFTQDGEIEIESISGKGEGTKRKVPIYHGYIKDHIYDTVFVNPVSGPKNPYLADVMVRFQDLAARTVDNMFNVDQAMFEQGKMPFPVWDPKGLAITNPSIFKSVFHLDPSSGSNEARNLGSVGKMWKAASGKRISKPPKLFLGGNMDFETTQQAVVNAARTSDHHQYQIFINGTLEQCRVSSSSGFNVMSRFFDAQVDGIKFNIRITHEYGPSTGTKAKSEIRKAWDQALNKSKFKLTLKEIWLNVDNVDEEKFQVLGSHPGGLYEIWMPDEIAKTFRKNVCKEPYRFPTEDEAKVANKNLGLASQQASTSEPNRSTVTNGGVRSAGTTARNPQQTTVMNNVSPNDLVRKWWEMGPKDMKAEWLHRCAFSYGGVHVNQLQGPPNSAQIPSNLIIGTVEANTAMLRTESFVKRIVQYTDYVDIQVETVIAYPENSEFKWMKNASYLWLAPMLRYTYTLYANQKYGVDPYQIEYSFAPFMADQVTRFECELDLTMEALCLGWKTDR